MKFPIQTYVSEFWHQSFFSGFVLGISTSNQAFSILGFSLRRACHFLRQDDLLVEGYFIPSVVQELMQNPCLKDNRAGFGKPHNPPLFPCRFSLVSASDSAGNQPIIRDLNDLPLRTMKYSICFCIGWHGACYWPLSLPSFFSLVFFSNTSAK